MRTFRAVVMGWLLALGMAVAVLGQGLPSWKDGEQEGKEAEERVAGDLLPTDEAVETDEQMAELDEPAAGEISTADSPLSEVPEKFWPDYFSARPNAFLVDPQDLLGPVNYRDRLAFLNYHAGDSMIDLYVYVFAGDQEIPGEVREEELIERLFSVGRPAAVVYYYMGAPERSVLYLSPSLTDGVSVAEQRRALESSVMQALKDVDPAGQIQEFLVQMSIRIYWMERMLGGTEGDGEVVPAISREGKTPKKSSRLMAMLRPHLENTKRLAVPAAVMAGALAAAFAMCFWLKRSVRYRFPEFEVEPRLGGGHAAGVGAVISFASAALPPAMQRDQVPDYLRRA